MAISKPLLFHVQRRALPAPTVPQAQAGIIDAPDVPAQMVIPAEAGLQPGDSVRAVMGPLFSQVQQVKPGVQTIIDIPASQLWQLDGQGSAVWAYEVMVNNNWQRSSPIMIAVTTKVNQENWVGESYREMRVGSSATFINSRVTLTFLRTSDLAIVIQNRRLFIGRFSQSRYVFPSSFTTFSGHVANIHNTAPAAHTLNFYDQEGGYIGNLHLPYTGTSSLPFTYSSPTRQRIWRVELIAGAEPIGGGINDTGFHFDDFSWK
ncbi:hypothetical protein [Pseudomonas sp. KU43P]|uniref:hypothetical protein n=1 Tax=Pseudomonas sp. KU43P TaxID=2487887 RepID=UPI002954F6E1|nr:hypothetical protein [Pseudomonas sp. KU43P]